jgi:hypothetical protein
MEKAVRKVVALLKPKRRWAQFSLGSMLIVITVLCVWLALLENARQAVAEYGRRDVTYVVARDVDAAGPTRPMGYTQMESLWRRAKACHPRPYPSSLDPRFTARWGADNQGRP